MKYFIGWDLRLRKVSGNEKEEVDLRDCKLVRCLRNFWEWVIDCIYGIREGVYDNE